MDSVSTKTENAIATSVETEAVSGGCDDACGVIGSAIGVFNPVAGFSAMVICDILTGPSVDISGRQVSEIVGA